MSLQKKKQKAKKKNAIKVILSTAEGANDENEPDEDDIDEDDDYDSGMYLEKEDVQVIYNALKNYKPVNDDEEMVYELLVEQVEESLVVDYKVKLRGVRW
jgi:hypothetical protein